MIWARWKLKSARNWAAIASSGIASLLSFGYTCECVCMCKRILLVCPVDYTCCFVISFSLLAQLLFHFSFLRFHFQLAFHLFVIAPYSIIAILLVPHNFMKIIRKSMAVSHRVSKNAHTTKFKVTRCVTTLPSTSNKFKFIAYVYVQCLWSAKRFLLCRTMKFYGR